jgi:hypothetical protein
VVLIVPHAVGYLPRSLNARVRSILFTGTLTKTRWTGRFQFFTDDPDEAEPVARILQAWREMANSLIRTDTTGSSGQAVSASVQQGRIQVVNNQVVVDWNLPADIAVRGIQKAAKRVAPHVLVCHQGQGLEVDAAAARRHLAHGDTLGACP